MKSSNGLEKLTELAQRLDQTHAEIAALESALAAQADLIAAARRFYRDHSEQYDAYLTKQLAQSHNAEECEFLRPLTPNHVTNFRSLESGVVGLLAEMMLENTVEKIKRSKLPHGPETADREERLKKLRANELKLHIEYEQICCALDKQFRFFPRHRATPAEVYLEFRNPHNFASSKLRALELEVSGVRQREKLVHDSRRAVSAQIQRNRRQLEKVRESNDTVQETELLEQIARAQSSMAQFDVEISTLNAELDPIQTLFNKCESFLADRGVAWERG